MAFQMGSFLRLGETLANVEGAIQASRLQATVGVPRSTFQSWLRHLRFQRALLDSPRGYRVDRARLMQVLTAHRVTQLAPAAEIPTSLGPQEISAILARERISYSLCMLSAANEWAFFEPRREMQVYVQRAQAARLARLLPPGERLLQVFAENVQSLDRAEHVKTRGAVRVTCPFLTALDCRAHPEGGAHASFVERVILKWRPDA